MSTSSKVLIIEDDTDTIAVIAYVLEEAGFTTITSCPEQYMKDINIHKPRVILLDHWIEHIRGSEICVSLKADPKTKHIPVILTSAINGIHEMARECKADDVLAKPFDIEDLEAKILKWSAIST